MDVTTSHDAHEFSATYPFRVEVPVDYDVDNVEVVEGDITFSADLEWDESEQEYGYSYSWEESSGQFDNINGDPPAGDDEFLADAHAFLVAQGIDESDIGW